MKRSLRKRTMADLNIYSANLQGGLLGWATFQSRAYSATDGVVVLNESLPGGSAAPTARRHRHPRGRPLARAGPPHVPGRLPAGSGDYVADTPAEASASLRLPDRSRHLQQWRG